MREIKFLIIINFFFEERKKNYRLLFLLAIFLFVKDINEETNFVYMHAT